MTLHRIRSLLAIFFIIFVGLPKAKQLRADSVELNDFSRLNKTIINKFITPSSYEELQSTIQYAQAHNLKISIAGMRHSQGGHTFFPNALVINLGKLNQIIAFDRNKKLITVQAGITWKDVQHYLHQHKLAVKIMQFVNIFTVGGSLSVNCNGIDPNYGPLIESIHSIKILLADGSIVTASHSKNSELFSLAIGGYGLFGIILEATIEVVEDSLYKRETKFLSLPEYVSTIKNIAHDPQIGFHFSYLSFKVYGKKLFGGVTLFNFKKLNTEHLSEKQNKKKRKLKHERFVAIRKMGTKLWSKSRLMKAFNWLGEGIQHGQIVSRNNIMRPPGSHSYVEASKETNLLQEYFIPVDNLLSFIDSLEAITKKLNQNLMLVAFRFIPQNTESYLSYTKTDRIGIVLFFNQKMTSEANKKTEKWTRHLIDTAIQLNGTYYLPSQLHASKEQILQSYPPINDFFQLKKKYDPNEVFMNHFYKKYTPY